MSNLTRITRLLGSRHRKFKKAEELHKKSRNKFFEAALEQNSERTLAKRTIDVPATSETQAREIAGRQHPTYDVVTVSPIDVDGKEENEYRVTLQENPKFLPFTFVNKEDGMVYSKSIRAGSVQLDDDLLKEQDPELWEEITEPQRVPKDVAELTEEQLAKLKPYLFETEPRLVLNAPRKAKEEELDE